MMRRHACLVLALATLAGCRGSDPASIGEIENLLAFVEIPAGADVDKMAV